MTPQTSYHAQYTVRHSRTLGSLDIFGGGACKVPARSAPNDPSGNTLASVQLRDQLIIINQ